MKYLGAHVSAGGGVENAPINEQEIGGKALGLFTKNQRQWNAKPLTEESIAAFGKNIAEAGIPLAQVLPHASYLINIGSPEEEKRAKSAAALKDEVERAHQLGIGLVNFHPGSHVKLVTEEECLALIAAEMNTIIAETEAVVLVLENTAGQGSNVGYRFEHLARIIELIDVKSRVGVCLDTCHAYAAGYDISTAAGWNRTMEEFDSVVGLDYLKGMHINDSQFDLGSRKDRHAAIGKGALGVEAFRPIMNDPRLEDMPLILETNEPELWPQEIKLLYGMIG
ncbi:MAG: deoxyribonuclease IV [Alkalispirochaetaceae bacterium]